MLHRTGVDTGGGLTAARPGADTNNKQGPEFEVESFMLMQAQLISRAVDPNRTLVRV